MFCAAQAGQAGLRVLLLDNGKKPGRKILMSGGGRCNFTNMYIEPAAYLSLNPHFANLRWRVIANGILSNWWANTALPGMRRPSASCFVMIPLSKSSTCCWRNVKRAACKFACVAKLSASNAMMKATDCNLMATRWRRKTGGRLRRPVDARAGGVAVWL